MSGDTQISRSSSSSRESDLASEYIIQYRLRGQSTDIILNLQNDTVLRSLSTTEPCRNGNIHASRKEILGGDLSIRATVTPVQARMYVFVMQCPQVPQQIALHVEAFFTVGTEEGLLSCMRSLVDDHRGVTREFLLTYVA